MRLMLDVCMTLYYNLTDMLGVHHCDVTAQAVWLVTFVAVVLLDVALGLVVGILFSVLTVVGSTQRSVTSLLHIIR